MLLSRLLSSAVFLTSVLASIADLQAELPECSIECLASGAEENDCEAADIACMCGKMEAMIKTVSPCLVEADCELEEITDTAKIVNQICAEVTGTNTTNSETVTDEAVPTLTETIAATKTPGAANNLRSAGWTGAMVIAVAGALL